MRHPLRSLVLPAVLLAEGLALGLLGAAIGHADDAPIAVLVGTALFLAFAYAAYCAARGARPETIAAASATCRDKRR